MPDEPSNGFVAPELRFLRLVPDDASALRTAIERVLQRGWFVLGPEVEAFEVEFAAAASSARSVGTGTDALALALRGLGIEPGDEVITTPLTAAFTAVLQRGWFVLGPEVEAFEVEFAAAASSARSVGTGTDALALALRGLGIEPGDEVITTPLTAAFTALAIVMAGAKPVFADIDPDRLTLSPSAVADAISSRTAALVPVHLYGQPAEMPALMAVAARHNLAVVEDCCQAVLSS